MTIKRVLIIAPLLLILFLLQSYLWVPTYEQQTRGNPERLKEYITASIGDASVLNPILSADAASSDIESMVFEGLIDRDEELRFRGRLATSWEIHEEAFFYFNEKAIIPGLETVAPEDVVDLIKKAKDGILSTDSEVQAALGNIQEISVIPPRQFITSVFEKRDKKDDGEKVIITVRAPARIRMVLSKVDQELFRTLSSILGSDYFSSFPAERYMDFDEDPGEVGCRGVSTVR